MTVEELTIEDVVESGCVFVTAKDREGVAGHAYGALLLGNVSFVGDADGVCVDCDQLQALRCPTAVARFEDLEIRQTGWGLFAPEIKKQWLAASAGELLSLS